MQVVFKVSNLEKSGNKNELHYIGSVCLRTFPGFFKISFCFGTEVKEQVNDAEVWYEPKFVLKGLEVSESFTGRKFRAYARPEVINIFILNFVFLNLVYSGV